MLKILNKLVKLFTGSSGIVTLFLLNSPPNYPGATFASEEFPYLLILI